MAYVDYAETERQKQVAELMDQGLHGTEIGRRLGISESKGRSHVRRMKAKAARQGDSPEHDMTRTVPDGYHVKGTSTLYDEDGKPRMQWVKSSIDHERQAEILKEALNAMAEDLPRIPPTVKPSLIHDDLMAVYPLGDPHIGVLSWGDETGQDWDLAIAEEKFCAVFDRLVKTAPPCRQAVIVNLGDYFHVDNMAGVTERSGHSLDTDGRFGKMIRVGIKIMRQMIQSALGHHESVRVINVKGNHDDTGALFLTAALLNTYENEPRLTVDESPSAFHYIQHGKVLIGTHHGHTCKMQNLPGVMAAERPKEWGDTTHRYWLTGHIHHDSMKEYAGCKVESFRTLAARDAYAAHAGYLSGQDSKCLVMHSEHGEIERHTVNISMV